MSTIVTTSACMFQSTPPRRRRLADFCTANRTHHSFNPRLHAGGDFCMAQCTYSLPSFNPRLHAGGDKVSALKRNNGVFVSIHASTQEATVALESWRLLY